MAFRGGVVLVTSAASGMGRLTSRRLADAGGRVVALDVDAEGLADTVEGRDGIQTVVQDVTDPSAAAELVKRVETDLGAIERLVNAAAIMPTGLLLEQDVALIHRIMEINYGGTVNFTQAVLPGMLARGRGELVNFASIAGWSPSLHFGAYNASKFAVVAYSEVLYHEIRGRGVRMACVCPPPVDTPLLAQATSQPRILGHMPPIRPELVLDAVEAALERDRLFVFPGRGTHLGVLLRRWVPGLVWRLVHRVEGR